MNELLIAPVKLDQGAEDSVAHSLKILSRVYNYNHWIFSMIRNQLGESVLEIGAGVGNISSFMLNVDELTCLEPHEAYREYLVRRLSKHSNVHVYPYRIEDCPNKDVKVESCDSVVCLNVLEHIPDDVAVLKICSQLLKPGGSMVLLVPAVPAIYGAVDKAMGHLRRYTRAGMKDVLMRSGYEVEFVQYMNFVGLFGWWWQGCVRKWDVIPEKGAILFDRLAPFLSAIEKLVPPFIGQSIVAVGRNKDTAGSTPRKDPRAHGTGPSRDPRRRL